MTPKSDKVSISPLNCFLNRPRYFDQVLRQLKPEESDAGRGAEKTRPAEEGLSSRVVPSHLFLGIFDVFSFFFFAGLFLVVGCPNLSH